MAEPYPIPNDSRFQDLTGRTFEKLTVLFYAGRKSSKYSLWHCRCECGKEVTLVSSRLTLGQTKSCVTCFRHRPKTKTRTDFEDLTGKIFGRLTVISIRRKKETNRTYCLCQCVCGEQHEARSDSLKDGSIQSCGCLNIHQAWHDEPIPEILQCNKCKESYPLNAKNFYRFAKHKYGFKPICAKCFRTQRNAQYNRTAKQLRLDCLVAYSGSPPKCQCDGCQETNLEFLTIDHISGGGRKHRQEIGSGNFYRWLKKNKFPQGFRVLCMNCNHAHGIYGYCPHTKK